MKIAKEKKYRVKTLVIYIAITAVFLTATLSKYSAKVNEDLSSNLVRLHVLANSDSEEDQKLKTEVREAIVSKLEPLLEESESVTQSKNIIQENMSEIIKVGQKVVEEKGYNYKVTATLGNFAFPTKKYGDIVLPAGYYDALRIVIGAGEGANWWCVLFPPLCFVDATYGTIPEEAKIDLQNNLTEQQYKLISSGSEEEIPVKIKFKTVEIFEQSKMAITGFLTGLFK